MAEALQLKMVDSLGFDKLDREITCSYCRSHFTDPRVLPCCHYFCRGCVKEVAAEAGRSNEPFRCPACQGEAEIDAGELPTAYFVNELKQRHSRVAKLENKVDAPCDMCSTEKAKEFCLQCAEFVCVECARSHRKMKAKFPDHRVLTLAQLREGGARQLPAKPSPPGTCPVHEESLKLFCFDCWKVICRDCILIDHAHHRHEFVKQAASYCRQSLEGNLVLLRDVQSDFAEAVKNVQEVKRNVSDQELYVSEYVERKFEEIFDALRKRKEELLEEASGITKQKMETLNAQEKSFGVAAGELARVIEFTEKNLEYAADKDLVRLHEQLLNRISKESEKQSAVHLAPSEEANLAVSTGCMDEIVQACRTKARVYLFPAQSSEVHMAEVGTATTHFIVDHSDTSHQQPVVAVASLKSLVDGSILPGKVVKTGKGLFEVSYTPRVRGRHEVTVEIDGRTVVGSPFLVFVKIPPSMLGLPVFVVEGLRHPYSVAFDAEQHLLVTESGGKKLRVFKKCGIKFEVQGFAEHEIESPTGLAVDVDGNIYVANVSNHTVSKYNREGVCVKVVGREGSQPGEFNHPSGVTVIGKRVLVCDRNNSRIQVFDRDLKYMYIFGSHGNEEGQLHWPYNIVEGVGGHVFITDCDNHRVQIFDSEGHYVHAFTGRGEGNSAMKRPVGACLGSDELLYVTEYAHHCVTVFKPSGDYVRSFGNYGRKKGEFCYPVGIAIDPDGFVYVCDQGNNRIQVF